MKTFYLVLLLLVIGLSASHAQRVYFIHVEGEIDPGLAPHIERGIKEAEESGAEAIIFKINTFGGRVDAATQIKDAILGTKLETIAFINNRAVSAGALIALSCRNIAMVPGGIIGAATVVDQTGQKVGEKYQSYMRSEMRSTAEKNGRNSQIAQAMVDERIVIEGLVDSTQLVTLTAVEAVQYKMADTLVSGLDELLKVYGYQKDDLVEIETNWAEDVVRFLNNPIISSILMMIGFLGLFAEIKTPGWGLPGTLGLAALALFFGSSYILQLASVGEILLFVGGVILLLLEIFVIPGFGIAGIGGILMILAALFLSLTPSDPFFDTSILETAIIQLTVALVGSMIGIYLLAKYLPKTAFFSRLVLSEEETSEQGFVSYPSPKELEGSEGIALTTLRPAGSAEFNGKRVDVVADWEYIEKGSRIKVLKVEGIKVVVKEVK